MNDVACYSPYLAEAPQGSCIYDYVARMRPDEEGGWVSYSDYLALRARVRALEDELKALREAKMVGYGHDQHGNIVPVRMARPAKRVSDTFAVLLGEKIAEYGAAMFSNGVNHSCFPKEARNRKAKVEGMLSEIRAMLAAANAEQHDSPFVAHGNIDADSVAYVERTLAYVYKKWRTFNNEPTRDVSGVVNALRAMLAEEQKTS